MAPVSAPDRITEKMTADGMALPSVSSLLQWARVAREAEPDVRVKNAPSSPSKRWFSDLGKATTVPEPLTPDIIHRASKELPQGASVALESCLTAFKVPTASWAPPASHERCDVVPCQKSHTTLPLLAWHYRS